MEPIYTVPEAKQKLGINDDQLKELVRVGRVHVLRQGNQICIRAADVDRIAEEDNAPREAFTQPATAAEAGAATAADGEEQQEPIALVTEQEMADAPPETHEIRSFGSSAGSSIGRSAHEDTHLTRQLLQQGGATRCRVFHAKLNDGAISYCENQINEWTDANPEIVIKFMSTCIGVFEGKSTEPHLIITVFY
jgi:hypothetical protein